MNRRLGGACAVLLLLTGCGGGESGGDSSDPRSSASEADVETDTAAGTGGCAWLGVEAVSAAVGADLVETAAGAGGCTFAADGDSPSTPMTVTVSHLDIDIDPEEYAEGTRELCEGDSVESDAGDVAFACSTGLAVQGFVFEGTDSVVVQVDDAPDTATGVAVAAALLDSVTPGG